MSSNQEVVLALVAALIAGSVTAAILPATLKNWAFAMAGLLLAYASGVLAAWSDS